VVAIIDSYYWKNANLGAATIGEGVASLAFRNALG